MTGPSSCLTSTEVADTEFLAGGGLTRTLGTSIEQRHPAEPRSGSEPGDIRSAAPLFSNMSGPARIRCTSGPGRQYSRIGLWGTAVPFRFS